MSRSYVEALKVVGADPKLIAWAEDMLKKSPTETPHSP
jgi:hypothetical protein